MQSVSKPQINQLMVVLQKEKSHFRFEMRCFWITFIENAITFESMMRLNSFFKGNAEFAGFSKSLPFPIGDIHISCRADSNVHAPSGSVFSVSAVFLPVFQFLFLLFLVLPEVGNAWTPAFSPPAPETTGIGAHCSIQADRGVAIYGGGSVGLGDCLVCQDTVPSNPADVIYVIAEEMAYFPGCDSLVSKRVRDECATAKMLEYLGAHIVYPPAAYEKGIQGTVVVTFVVEKDGSISGAKVIREIGGGCGEEALRVIQSMNENGIRWIPGKQRNKPVRIQYNMPIKFKI